MAEVAAPNWLDPFFQNAPETKTILQFLRTLTPHFTAMSKELTDAEWTGFRALAQKGAVEGIIFMSFTNVAGETCQQYMHVQGDYVNTKPTMAIRTDRPIRCDLVEARLTGTGEQWAQYLKGEDTDPIKYRAFVLTLLWRANSLAGASTLTSRRIPDTEPTRRTGGKMKKCRQLRPNQNVLVVLMLAAIDRLHIQQLHWGQAKGKMGVMFGDHFFAEATLADVKILAEAKLIHFDLFDNQQCGTVTMENAAYAAADSCFGMPKRDFVVRAAYEAAHRMAGSQFSVATVELFTALPRTDVETQMEQLVADGLAEHHRMLTEQAGRMFSLTRAGIATAEDVDEEDEQKQGFTMRDFIVNNNAPVNAPQQIAVGPNASNTMNLNPNLQEVIELLDRSKSQLAALPSAARQEAEEQIEHIKDEVMTGKPLWKKIKAYMTVLVLTTTGIATFQTQMATVCEKLGVEKQAIEQVFQHAKPK